MALSLIRLMSYSFSKALDEELVEREEALKNYLKETQEIDLDYLVWIHGDAGVVEAIQEIHVDDYIRKLTDPKSILNGVRKRLEVMQRCCATRTKSG